MKEIAKIIWKSPSNIAFIKYWGKLPGQIPRNASLSMTLDACNTTTTITLQEKILKRGVIDFQFFFEGSENDQFTKRISNYLSGLLHEIPFLTHFNFLIESKNNFPHSAGIASSASAMSALALCLNSLLVKYGNQKTTDFYQSASRLARLGSGSASRSVFGLYATWGRIEGITGTTNEYATPFEISGSGMFSCLRDTILIINPKEKKISSSIGHDLMEGHPYSESRYSDATKNIGLLMGAMNLNDFNQFALILEHEALSIHAMMMTAGNWYTLLHPNTLVAIEKIRRFRENTGARICFTLDAGPNVHVIYPAQDDNLVQPFIQSELIPICFEERYIADNIGLGPELIMEEFI